jgi:uncharacterized DUF497 family protein
MQLGTPAHPAIPTKFLRFIPVTWVALYTVGMGNTFGLHPVKEGWCSLSGDAIRHTSMLGWLPMKSINWNLDKNQKLADERGISFEDVVVYIQQGEILDIVEHPTPEKYPNQRMFVLNIDEYVYLVPYVETREEVFLKTIIPSRKATKMYLGGK